MPAPNHNVAEEIVQVAMMRGCWFRAEEIFERQIRTICEQWTDGDLEKATAFRRQLSRGKTTKIPSELAFATMPLVDMLLALRKGRQHVDAALKMAVKSDPRAVKDIVTEVPEGYISYKEACEFLNISQINNLRGAAHFIAQARSVKLAASQSGRDPLRRFFAVEDLEMAKTVIEEEQAEKLTNSFARLTKRKGLAPLDAIPAFKVAKRIGMPTGRLDAFGAYHEGEECSHFPKMYRFGRRWFSFEADITAFLERRSRFECLRQKGWLDTRAAAARIGVTCATLIRDCRDSGVEPEYFGHHALYSPSDLESIQWIRESKDIQAAARKREREAFRIALQQQRAEERQKERVRGILDGIPEGGIPIQEVLLRIGMRRKRFAKIRQGLSNTPIPRCHKAPNGRLYCMADDLAAFCSKPQIDWMARERKELEQDRYAISRAAHQIASSMVQQ